MSKPDSHRYPAAQGRSASKGRSHSTGHPRGLREKVVSLVAVRTGYSGRGRAYPPGLIRKHGLPKRSVIHAEAGEQGAFAGLQSAHAGSEGSLWGTAGSPHGRPKRSVIPAEAGGQGAFAGLQLVHAGPVSRRGFAPDLRRR